MREYCVGMGGDLPSFQVYRTGDNLKSSLNNWWNRIGTEKSGSRHFEPQNSTRYTSVLRIYING